jgi:uncharacterized SAM-binding protein YcdF (DUF218 family)
MNRVHDGNPVGFPAAAPSPIEQPAATRPPVPPAAPARRWRRSAWGELWRWLLTALVFVLVAGLVLMIGLVLAIYWQARTDQVRPVDAIVVLGTAQYNGRPGPVLQARLDRALEVYRAGYAGTIVVTGGRAPGDQYTEAEAGEMYLLEQGVPAAAILRENAGRDTWNSMVGVAGVLEPLGLDRVLLVSDGFHLLRAKLMARDLGLEPYGAAALASPIVVGGSGEFSFAIREAFGIVGHVVGGR